MQWREWRKMEEGTSYAFAKLAPEGEIRSIIFRGKIQRNVPNFWTKIFILQKWLIQKKKLYLCIL